MLICSVPLPAQLGRLGEAVGWVSLFAAWYELCMADDGQLKRQLILLLSTDWKRLAKVGLGAASA